jgi:hypothetical protein
MDKINISGICDGCGESSKTLIKIELKDDLTLCWLCFDCVTKAYDLITEEEKSIENS